MRSARLAAVGAALVLILAACSSGSGKHASGTTTSAPRTTKTASPTSSAGAPASTPVVRPAPWSLPAPLDREVAANVAGQILTLGGIRVGGTTAIVDVMDPATGVAHRLGLLATAAHDAAGGMVGGRPVVFGGGSSATSDAVQLVPADGAGRVVGHLPRRRADLSSASTGGVTYLAGGYDGTTMTPEVLATTDGLQFRTVAELAVPVRYPAVALVGNRLFVMGGATSGGENAGVDTNVVQAIDVHTAAVSVLTHLPETLSHAVAVTLGGHVYVLGGHVGGRWSDQVAALDPANGSLRVVAHLPRAVSDAAVAVIGNTAYLLGGEVGPSAPVASVVELSV